MQVNPWETSAFALRVRVSKLWDQTKIDPTCADKQLLQLGHYCNLCNPRSYSPSLGRGSLHLA